VCVYIYIKKYKITLPEGELWLKGKDSVLSLSLSIVVDIMLQIARGMEYLHSRKIFLGDLNPSNVLLKARNST
jgi:serine/threonine protein kinase